MLVLDTNHLSELDRGFALGIALRRRLDQAREPVATTIATVEERLRGWLTAIARAKTPADQVAAYAWLQGGLRDLSSWTILPFDQSAAAKFVELRSSRLRVGTMDLKIASIVLANDAKLLTRNLRDFEPIPGLVAEDWL